MDIDLLKTFLEVNRTRHFGQAANNLFLTPAAVSARVRQLESVLGVALFQRSRNNIQLTAEGERLLPHAETLLQGWAQARQAVALQADRLQQLNLGATCSLWPFGLGQALAALQAALPDVAIRAEAHPADRLDALLQERALDLVFALEAPDWSGIRAEKVGQVKLVLVSSDPAAHLKSALQTGYVRVDWGVAFDLFHVRRFGDTGVPLLQTNMGLLALDHLQMQAGAAYLPQSVLARPEGKMLVRVKGAPVFARPLFAIYRAASDRKELVSRLLAQLRPLVV